jgi:hypothetical protein
MLRPLPPREIGSSRQIFDADMSQGQHAKSVFLPQVTSEYSPTLPDFAKDGNPTVIPTARLLAPEIAHIFLIRTPKEYIPSLHGLLVSSKTGIGQFDPEEVRMHESKRLYDFIALRGVGGRTPVVIDSEDLIGHPEAVLRHLCEIGGMEYRPAMLAWNAGDARVSELYCLSRAWRECACRSHRQTSTDPCNVADEGALNSTGILPKNDASAHADAAALPEVQEAIEANEPIYAYLKARAVRFA